MGIPYEIDDNLREWKTGNDGFVQDFDLKHYVEHPDERPEGGESFNSFLGRVQKAQKEYNEIPENKTAAHHP
jgi:broad specificity phosphatase PhoE